MAFGREKGTQEKLYFLSVPFYIRYAAYVPAQLCGLSTCKSAQLARLCGLCGCRQDCCPAASSMSPRMVRMESVCLLAAMASESAVLFS